jgi:hypothetical protein
MELRLTSMWYTLLASDRQVDKAAVHRTSKRLSVCYSMHSSLQEIVKTIDYLKPRIVTPLVMPCQSTMEEVFDVHNFSSNK